MTRWPLQTARSAEVAPGRLDRIVLRLSELLDDDPGLMGHVGELFEVFADEGLFDDEVILSSPDLWAIICAPEAAAA